MKAIIIFVSMWLSCNAVEYPLLYQDSAVKPSGEPQFIHASLPDLVAKKSSDIPTGDFISNSFRPNNDYISESFSGYNPGGYSYNSPFVAQSGSQVGYQYIRNAKPTFQAQLPQTYPLQQTQAYQQTYYPRYNYQYQTRYYPQYISPSYGFLFPFKK